MKDFQMFLDDIANLEKRNRMEDVINYVKKKFPQLKEEIKWNQPMFTDNGTYIIGFSIAKGHIAVAPEPAVIKLFQKDIENAGYTFTQGLYRIKWKDKIDYNLLDKMIAYNIEDKKDSTTFWR